MTKETKEGFLDRAMGKLASRRLWVWLTCTFVFLSMAVVYMATGALVEGEVMMHFADKWVDVSMVFIAVVGAQDIMKSWRGDG
jgi:hypothetical protein